MSLDSADFSLKLKKALDHVASDLSALRTGRATVQLLDPVTVEAYGSFLKISEVATVTSPDPTLLVISPWDKGLLHAIEKGISASGLNLQAIVAGDIIRVPVPPLTEERRKEMVKLLQQKLEAGRVMLRNIRADVKRVIEQQKGDEGISEDDIDNDLDELEALFKEYNEKLESMGVDKERELMTV